MRNIRDTCPTPNQVRSVISPYFLDTELKVNINPQRARRDHLALNVLIERKSKVEIGETDKMVTIKIDADV